MRVLVVSAFWPTPSNGISGIFVCQQVRGYVELGADVTVLVPQTIRGRGRARPYFQSFAGVPVFSPCFVDIPQALSGGSRALRVGMASCGAAVQRALWRHNVNRSFDVVHIQDIRYVGLAYPIWKQAVVGPAILTIHGFDPFLEARASQPWLAELMAPVWSDVSHVVLVGCGLRDYAQSLGVPPSKTCVVPNGTDLPDSFSTVQRSLEARRVVLSVSNLVDWKGLDFNIRALATISKEYSDLDWEYRIVGDGPARKQLEGLAQALGVDHRVRFLGRLDYEATMREMEGCDVFSLPSWREPFGIVYLEAMGRGRPVVGCTRWGAEETVRDGVDGLLVEPKNEISLCAALSKLLMDPELCHRMGEAARERAEAFSWRRNAQTYVELVQEMATSSSEARSTLM